jgi:UDP-3-O-[3-hydroxymyristoyl] glucosamine N-acyltransferase
MIALTYRTALNRFEYLLGPDSDIDQTIFLDYQDGSLHIDSAMIESLRNKKVILLIDNIHLNYTRMELYAKLRIAGVKFGNLISPHALISSNAKLGENLIIHHGVKIDGLTALKSTIEVQENTCIKDGCTIGAGVFIGHHSFIESNVKIGSNVNIGNHITVCKNASIGSNVALGVDHQTIKGDVLSGTFSGELFPSVYRYI